MGWEAQIILLKSKDVYDYSFDVLHDKNMAYNRISIIEQQCTDKFSIDLLNLLKRSITINPQHCTSRADLKEILREYNYDNYDNYHNYDILKTYRNTFCYLFDLFDYGKEEEDNDIKLWIYG